VVALELLRFLKIPARLALGGMVYRVGPDPQRDVVAYCAEGNVGRITEDGLRGHGWLQCGDDVVDFSVGHWRTTTTDDECMLGPLQWTIEPPEFFWQPSSSFAPNRGQYTPALGHAYYTGWQGPIPYNNVDEMRLAVTGWIIRHFAWCCKHYSLQERLSDLRSSQEKVIQ
jgi:hypothetical protein